jgi:two-component system response regulator YesN
VLKSLVEKVIIELERKAEEVKPIGKSSIENRLQGCLSFIQKNYYKSISLEEIANNANMSPNYFSTYFRKSVGCTFREYLKNLRMRFSISFLTNFETPVFQISEMVGYNSYEQFERTFKQEFGISPSTFRDTLRKQRKNTLNVIKTNVRFNGTQLYMENSRLIR